MRIETELINNDQSVSKVVYEDMDDFSSLVYDKIRQVYAVCLWEGKLAIVFHGRRQTWGLPGGSLEPGESLLECLSREIREETNTEVVWSRPVGLQAVDTNESEIYQLRYVCQVRPLGRFEGDPAGSITEVKFIDPAEYKRYFDWGEIGEQIIKRALILVGNE